MNRAESGLPRRRVLLVPSSWCPAMIADMQRVRHLAWELPQLGWDVEILTPGERFQHPSCLDPDSAEFFADGVAVHAVDIWQARLFRMLNMRGIAWRALYPLWRAGIQLLRNQQFDLVYLSTTSFPLFALGPLWFRRFQVPYVLDFHDPWVRASRRYRTTRHVLKNRVTGWLSHYLERQSVMGAAGLVSVSPVFLDELLQRYSACRPDWSRPGRHAVIPFGVLEHDLREAQRRQTVEGGAAADNEIRIHYVGAGGGIMERSFRLVCRILAALRAEAHPLIERVRVRLFGTTYGWAEGDPRYLQDVAGQCGVGDLVAEEPRRVTYRRSLELLLQADGMLILGVDDRGYMPSKLFSYAAAGKPLLTACRRNSPLFDHFRDEPQLGQAVWFDDSEDMPLPDACRAMRQFLSEAASRQTADRSAVIAPYRAANLAKQHAELFEECLHSAPGGAVAKPEYQLT